MLFFAPFAPLRLCVIVFNLPPNCSVALFVAYETLKTETLTRPRKAIVTDVPKMQKIINHFADRNEMLHKSLNELYEHIRDFTVMEEDGEILGCAAIHVVWDDLAELKSVAVSSIAQGRGVGKALLQALVVEARACGKHVLVGGIESGNQGSIALHQSLGFVCSGNMPQVGCKFGRWLDLQWWQLQLDQAAAPPP